VGKKRALVIAARQPAFTDLLEQSGFDVDIRTRPIDGDLDATPDVAVIFRGRLIGRGQAARLAQSGVAVVEIMTVDPPGTSSARWIRLSNRIGKSDLVQVVQAVADRPDVSATEDVA
jgi:hypothetical protein